jgi:hypothetical protein
MEKEIFKVGDRVFHFLCGWGTIKEIKDSMIYIEFNGQKTHVSSNNNLLSFTKYTLEGFSQERPIVLPEVGELCLVRRCNTDNWFLDKFQKFEYGYYYCENNKWEQIKRIKILD